MDRPHPHAVSISVGLVAVAIAATTVIAVNRVYSGSVDFAHHYALIAYLAEHLQVPAPDDAALYAMSYYPPASHAIAAVLSRVVGSPLLGMQITALLSLGILWAAVGAWLAALPNAARFPAFVAFAALAALAQAIGVELHGRELISHYLFSQLVAQAAALTAIAFVAWKLRSGWSPARTMWLVAVLAPMVAALHLLPGLLLVGALGFAGTIYALALGRGGIRSLVAAGAVSLGALVATVASPAFRAMRKLSEHNGSLPLALADSSARLALLAATILLLSVALACWWIRKQRRNEGRESAAVWLLAAYGLALATLFFLQLFALWLGHGSEYAVRKYAFAMQATLILQAAAVVGLVSTRRDEYARLVPFSGPVARVFPALCVIGVVMPMLGTSIVVIKLSTLMRTESFLGGYRLLGSAGVPGKGDYVIGISEHAPAFNYMFSIGVLRGAAEPNGFNILSGEIPSQPDKVDRVFTSSGSPWDVPRCRLHVGTDGINVVQAQCAMSEQIKCEGDLDFTDGGWLPIGVLTGFSSPWAQGRWSESAKATLTCTPVRPKTVARVHAYGFVKNNHRQRVTVSAGGVVLQEAVFTAEGEERVLSIALPDTCRPTCRIEFDLPDAVSPAALGVSPDARNLAISVRKIEFR